MTMYLEGEPFQRFKLLDLSQLLFTILLVGSTKKKSVGIMSSFIYPALAQAVSYTSITLELHYNFAPAL